MTFGDLLQAIRGRDFVYKRFCSASLKFGARSWRKQSEINQDKETQFPERSLGNFLVGQVNFKEKKTLWTEATCRNAETKPNNTNIQSWPTNLIEICNTHSTSSQKKEPTFQFLAQKTQAQLTCVCHQCSHYRNLFYASLVTSDRYLIKKWIKEKKLKIIIVFQF